MSDSLIKGVLTAIIVAILIGMGGRMLYQMDALTHTTNRLENDSEWTKLVLTKMADRMNVDHPESRRDNSK